MENGRASQPSAGTLWQAKQVYAMAAICLVVGLAVGYLFRASQPPAVTPGAGARVQANAQPPSAAGPMGGNIPSPEEMKQMADQKAAPLLEKLKSDPANRDLLIQTGSIYQSAHQYKEAASYYAKVLQADPKNVAIRTEMASCLYRNGDVDGAIGQLQQALQYDPKDANSLYNLGMIKWLGKQDRHGAEAAWQLLLNSNPQLSPERKASVQKMMAEVRKQVKN
ncbi:MAG: tetratricopeptide repeat protein [Terriglobales bacterium]